MRIRVVKTFVIAALQVHLAELLENAGADIIQTEGGVSSAPTQAGVAGMIEKVGSSSTLHFALTGPALFTGVTWQV